MSNASTLIHLVISTLNDVEVKGKDNLDRLLGSINALENVVQILEAPPVPPASVVEKKETENGG